MKSKSMPWWLRTVLRSQIRGITLPPFGMYLRPGLETVPQLQAHEAAHWAQYQQLGLVRFYMQYIWYTWRYGYFENPMEVEAREQASHV